MTKKETLRMNSLIAENAMLKEEISKQLGHYGDILSNKITLEARIQTLREVMDWPIGEEYNIE